MSQSVRKEKIISLIKDSTPTHSIKKSSKNIDVVGFDVLDENKNHLSLTKLTFFPGSQFYVVLYTKRKIIRVVKKENELNYHFAFFNHENAGYFRSIKTVYLIGKKEIQISPKEWQIGGIYKVQFTFKIPEFALPGDYVLRINIENSGHPKKSTLTINTIKIDINRQKVMQRNIVDDYNLPLDGCLLNPAVQGDAYISFPWRGNIEFFIDNDIRNFKKIIVNSKGTPALGVFPNLRIYIGQTKMGSVYVNSEWKKYIFRLKLDTEAHILKVRFDNGGEGPIKDRNMYVNLIKLVR